LIAISLINKHLIHNQNFIGVSSEHLQPWPSLKRSTIFAMPCPIEGKTPAHFGGAYAYGRDHMQKFNYEVYDIPLTWAEFLLGQSYLAYGVPYSNIYESADSVGDKSETGVTRMQTLTSRITNPSLSASPSI
jgi:hypothetical protein